MISEYVLLLLFFSKMSSAPIGGYPHSNDVIGAPALPLLEIDLDSVSLSSSLSSSAASDLYRSVQSPRARSAPTVTNDLDSSEINETVSRRNAVDSRHLSTRFRLNAVDTDEPSDETRKHHPVKKTHHKKQKPRRPKLKSGKSRRTEQLALELSLKKESIRSILEDISRESPMIKPMTSPAPAFSLPPVSPTTFSTRTSDAYRHTDARRHSDAPRKIDTHRHSDAQRLSDAHRQADPHKFSDSDRHLDRHRQADVPRGRQSDPTSSSETVTPERKSELGRFLCTVRCGVELFCFNLLCVNDKYGPVVEQIGSGIEELDDRRSPLPSLVVV